MGQHGLLGGVNWEAGSIPKVSYARQTCSGKFIAAGNVVSRFSDRGIELKTCSPVRRGGHNKFSLQIKMSILLGLSFIFND
jgi:hypothetical protein